MFNSLPHAIGFLLDPSTQRYQSIAMDPTNKQLMQVRQPSVSASASNTASTVGKTPLERMNDALELGRRGRLLQQLVRNE